MGKKMSKSRDNTLNIFLPEKQLRKQVMKIQTDSTPLEEPKDWSTCNCFAIYALLASESETAAMKANYQGGNYGYGHAKQALFELILSKFEGPRERYNHFMSNPQLIDEALKVGALKAKKVADGVLQRVREKLGY
jgi:tryptophanyl-tRNA synthetase